MKLISQHSFTISGHEHAVCYRIYCHLLSTTEEKNTYKPTENVVVHHVPTQHWHGSLTQQETIRNASICFFFFRSLTNSRFNLWVCVQLAWFFFRLPANDACSMHICTLHTRHFSITYSDCVADSKCNRISYVYKCFYSSTFCICDLFWTYWFRSGILFKFRTFCVENIRNLTTMHTLLCLVWHSQHDAIALTVCTKH